MGNRGIMGKAPEGQDHRSAVEHSSAMKTGCQVQEIM
jgi:hypothetical protein